MLPFQFIYLLNGRGYLPELFRQIRTYLPELFRQIKTYLPEPVPAKKNLFAGTPSVGSLNVFHLRDGFFGPKKWITPQLVEWQLFESNNCRFLKFDVRYLFDKMKNLVFKVFSDKSQSKILYRHIFEDFSLSSDGAGSVFGKRHILDLLSKCTSLFTSPPPQKKTKNKTRTSCAWTVPNKD